MCEGKKGHQGYCKNCGSERLEYDTRIEEGESIGYPFTCSNCSHEGTEWYELAYVETVMCCEEPI